MANYPSDYGFQTPSYCAACGSAELDCCDGTPKPKAPPVAHGTVDVGTITEYGLTQKLSNVIRCF